MEEQNEIPDCPECGCEMGPALPENRSAGDYLNPACAVDYVINRWQRATVDRDFYWRDVSAAQFVPFRASFYRASMGEAADRMHIGGGIDPARGCVLAGEALRRVLGAAEPDGDTLRRVRPRRTMEEHNRLKRDLPAFRELFAGWGEAEWVTLHAWLFGLWFHRERTHGLPLAGEEAESAERRAAEIALLPAAEYAEALVPLLPPEYRAEAWRLVDGPNRGADGGGFGGRRFAYGAA